MSISLAIWECWSCKHKIEQLPLKGISEDIEIVGCQKLTSKQWETRIQNSKRYPCLLKERCYERNIT